ncbi:MAG: hydrogenase iron-sulfur subunit [Bacillota bacterium]|jgi:coenzyme F420-reducing hydrogenase delta subunit
MPVEWQPKIVGFACRWCTYAGADLAGTSRMQYPSSIRLVRVPCSGRVNPSFVIRAFQRGADGVLVAGCHPGDCHYTSGNLFTRRRYSLVQRFLGYMGIEPERFRVEWISAAEGARFAQVVKEMTRDIQALGPNRKMREEP